MKLLTQMSTSELVKLITRGAASPELQLAAERELDWRVPVWAADLSARAPGVAEPDEDETGNIP